MTKKYRQWYNSKRNYLVTLGAVTLMGFGASLYGYNCMTNADNSLKNHSLEKTLVVDLENKVDLNKSIAVAGGIIGFGSLILGLSVLGAHPKDF